MCIGSWVAQIFFGFTQLCPLSRLGRSQAVQSGFSSTVGCISCFKLGKCPISKSLGSFITGPFHSSTHGLQCGGKACLCFPLHGVFFSVSLWGMDVVGGAQALINLL